VTNFIKTPPTPVPVSQPGKGGLPKGKKDGGGSISYELVSQKKKGNVKRI